MLVVNGNITQIKKKQNFGNELDSFLETLRSKYPSFDTEMAQNAIADSFKAHVGEFDSAELLLDISDRQATTIDYQVSTLFITILVMCVNFMVMPKTASKLGQSKFCRKPCDGFGGQTSTFKKKQREALPW